MLLSLIVIVLLVSAFMMGYRRGFLYQVYLLAATFVAFFLARFTCQWLSGLTAKTMADWLAQFDGHLQIFSTGLIDQIANIANLMLAFGLVYGIAKLVLRIVGLFFHFVKNKTALGTPGRIIAGLLSVAVSYFSIQLWLTMLALLPNDSLQTFLAQSGLARSIVTGTPFLSEFFRQLFHFV